MKWTGHALAADSPLSDTFDISTETPTEPSSPVSVSQSSTQITVTTGSFTGEFFPLRIRTFYEIPSALAVFNTSGDVLIQSLLLDGQIKAQNGSLVVHLQNSPDEPELVGDKPSVYALNGTIDSVTVEQSGPVRAVIKVWCLELL